MFTVAMATVLAISLLIAYIARIYPLSPKAAGDAPHAATDHSLTRFVKRLLDAAWFILVVAAVLWPITALGVGLNFFSDPEARNVDVFLGFSINPDVLPEATSQSTTTGDALVRGRSKVQISTPSSIAWFVSAAISQLCLIVVLYGLAQLRKLFTSLVGGGQFSRENAGRIRRIGIVVISWHLVMPLLQYFGGRVMLNSIEVDLHGMQFYPALELNLVGMFVGLAIIVLSRVMREAADIHQDHALTI